MNRTHFKHNEVIEIIRDYLGYEGPYGEISYVGSYWDNPKDYEVNADYGERWQFRSDTVMYDFVVLEKDGHIYVGTDHEYVLLHEGA